MKKKKKHKQKQKEKEKEKKKKKKCRDPGGPGIFRSSISLTPN